MALHPVIQKLLDSARAAGRPQLCAGTADEARAQVTAMRVALGAGPAQVAPQAVQIPTRSGSVPARLFWPVAAPQGLVVYVHGGGWVCGELDDFDLLCRLMAHRSGGAVLLVDASSPRTWVATAEIPRAARRRRSLCATAARAWRRGRVAPHRRPAARLCAAVQPRGHGARRCRAGIPRDQGSVRG